MGKGTEFLHEEIMDTPWTRQICYSVCYAAVIWIYLNPSCTNFLLSAHINNWCNKFHMLRYLQLRTFFQTSRQFLSICSHGMGKKMSHVIIPSDFLSLSNCSCIIFKVSMALKTTIFYRNFALKDRVSKCSVQPSLTELILAARQREVK